MIRWKSTYRRSATDAQRAVTEGWSEVPRSPAPDESAGPVADTVLAQSPEPPGPAEPPPAPSEPAAPAPAPSEPAAPAPAPSEPPAPPAVYEPPAPPAAYEPPGEPEPPGPVHPPHAPGFPPEYETLAAANAGGWVYEVGPGFTGQGPVPVEHIVGAWRIGEDGSATGEFVPNAQFRGTPPEKDGASRRMLVPAILALIAILVVGAVIVLLATQSSSSKSAQAPPKPPPVATLPAQPTSPTQPTSTPAAGHAAPTTSSGSRSVPPVPPSPSAAQPASVRLEVIANERVWACVESHTSQVVVDAQILPAGSVSAPFVSSSFRVFLGNGGVSFRINGHVHRLAASSDPVAYRVSTQGVTALPGLLTPPCP
jgi:hypothetical protein